MQSMTGFGVGKAPYGQGHVTIEIRSVNHRFLELRIKAPREIAPAEPLIENLVRKKLSRGYCTINVYHDGTPGSSATLDAPSLKKHLQALIGVAKEMEVCLTDLVPVLSNAPDLFITSDSCDPDTLNEAVRTALVPALEGVIKMRKAEGRSMGKEIAKHLEGIASMVAQIEGLAQEHAAAAFESLKQRLDAIVVDGELAMDRGRLETEAALLVDKASIDEEIVRLQSHCDQMGTVLGSKKSSGRKMEFLLQEMVRETNTIGAKASMAEIAHIVVEIKTTLEKIREMVQNIE